MKKVLLIQGAYRVGDCFHLIPYFEENKDNDITWAVGRYESEVAMFLSSEYKNISRLYISDDGVPGNLRDREVFRDRMHQELKDSIHLFDKVEDRIDLSFDVNPNGYSLKEKYFDFVSEPKQDYICTHLDTISDWKRHSKIRDLKLEGKVFGLGRKGDFILPNSLDFRGETFKDICELLSKCKLFVGIHSAISCLSLYLNVPSIVIHPMEGLLKFGDLRKGMQDLIMPTTEQVMEAVHYRLQR